MKWNQSYSVGIDEIDQQHKKLIDILAQLIKATDEKNSKSVIKDILDKLVQYTVYHFNTEEQYFDTFNYEKTAQHKEEHKKFTDKVAAFVQDYKEDRILLSADVLMFLSNWIQNHIKGTDKQYTACFQENGLAGRLSTRSIIEQSKPYRDREKAFDPKSTSRDINFSVIMIAFAVFVMIVGFMVNFV